MQYDRKPVVSGTWANLLAAGVAVLGALVIIGWLTRQPALIRVLPTLPAMKFNSALCLLLSGVALLLHGRDTRSARVVALVCGALVTLTAGATLLQFITARPFVLDQIFQTDFLYPHTRYPGRMAPPTAVGLLLVGIAILLSPRQADPDAHRLRANLVCACGLLAGWLGLITVVGLPLRGTPMMSYDNSASMALHTALAMLAMGGVLFLRGIDVLGWDARQRLTWIPALAFVITVTAPLNIWQILRDEQLARIQTQTRAVRDQVRQSVQRDATSLVAAMQHMADRWALYGDPPRAETWLPDAWSFLRDYRTLRAIAVVDPDLTRRLRAPPSPTQPNGVIMELDDARREVFAIASETRKPRLSKAVRLISGGTGTLIVVPVLRGNRLAGYMVASAEFSNLLDTVLSGVAPENGLRVSESGTQLYERRAGAPDSDTPASFIQSADIDLYGVTWQIEVWPGAAALGPLASPVPYVALATGAITALLIAIALRMTLVAKLRTRVARVERDRARHEADQRIALERTLSSSEARYMRLLELSGEGVLLLDADGRIERANASAERMLGVDIGAAAPRHLVDHAVRADRERLGAYLGHAALASGAAIEISLMDAAGAALAVLLSASPLREDDGRATGTLVLLADITAIRANEARLMRLTSLYATLGRIGRAIARIDERDALLAEVCRIAVQSGGIFMNWIGFPDPLTGRFVIAASAGAYLAHLDGLDISIDPDLPTGQGAGGRAFRERRTVIVNDYLNDASMAPWHARTASSPMRAIAALPLIQAGVTVGVWFMYSDHVNHFDADLVDLMNNLAEDLSFALTRIDDRAARRQAEEIAHRLDVRLGRVLTSINDAFFALDRDWRFTYINPRAERTLNWPAGAMLGASFLELFPGSTETGFGRHYLRAMQSGKALSFEEFSIPLQTWIEAHVYPFEDGLSIVFRDVGERHAADERLRDAIARLETSNRELEEFAFVASHDLQEPLRKIRAFTQRIHERIDGLLDPVSRADLERVEGAAARMQTLLGDLLVYSRVTTGARPHVAVPLDETVHQVLDDLADQIARTGGSVRVTGLPVARGDATQLRQLFQNLIGNALKFRHADTPPRVTVIDATSERERADGLCVIVVSDQGIGIEPKYSERIFAPFQRLHGRSVYEGSGMGLAIVRKIIERHHGTIAVQSSAGKGARFVVTLPADQASVRPLTQHSSYTQHDHDDQNQSTMP